MKGTPFPNYIKGWKIKQCNIPSTRHCQSKDRRPEDHLLHSYINDCCENPAVSSIFTTIKTYTEDGVNDPSCGHHQPTLKFITNWHLHCTAPNNVTFSKQRQEWEPEYCMYQLFPQCSFQRATVVDSMNVNHGSV